MIIVVGGIKGGTGKTTIATNLAIIGSHLGRKMLLVDADDQETASEWAEQRDQYWKAKVEELGDWQALSFPTIKLGGKLIYEQLKRLRADYDDIVVDTGGRDTTSQRSALLIADYFIIPFKPRSFDVWTISKVKELIEEVQPLNKNLKGLVCLNQGDPQGLDNDEAFKILEESPHWKMIEACIKHRKAFANAASKGLGIYELEKKERDKKAIDEIYAVYDAIYCANKFPIF